MLRRIVLEHSGYQVFPANTAAEALSFVRDNHIDLVITDLWLGDALGTEVAAAIKQLRPDLPIILLSGTVELPEQMDSVDMFISKADGTEALLGAIAGLLTRSKAA